MKRTISIFLSILLLSSNMGFSIGTHYCGGKAVKSKIVLGDPSINCGMPNMDEECQGEFDHKDSFKKLPCCQNQYDQIETDHIQKVNPSIVISNSVTPILIFLFIAYDFRDSDFQRGIFRDSSPPFLNLDIPIQNQEFLL